MSELIANAPQQLSLKGRSDDPLARLAPFEFFGSRSLWMRFEQYLFAKIPKKPICDPLSG